MSSIKYVYNWIIILDFPSEKFPIPSLLKNFFEGWSRYVEGI